MPNLRILKKLSRRAAPLLLLLGDTREQFRAEPGESYTGLLIRDRKHWVRLTCRPGYEGVEGDTLFKTRSGRSMVMRHPSHPQAGTIMVGATSGYYEPEWTEETAWEALLSLVQNHFTDWSQDTPRSLRRLRAPREIFQAAEAMLAAQIASSPG